MKITNKNLKTIPKKYTQIVLTKDAPESIRFVEKESGHTECRIGVGEFKKLNARTLRTAVRSIVQTAKTNKLEYIALPLSDSPLMRVRSDEGWSVATIVENLMLAEYEYTAYKSKQPSHVLKEVLIPEKLSKAGQTGYQRGMLLAEYANLCRDIANTPGGDMTPALLASAAARAVKGTKATAKALGLSEIKKLKMNGLLSVGKGAKDKPRFIVVEYWGAGKPKKSSTKKQSGKTSDKHHPVVFVGKGITFDTGGLQIKPGMAMYEMHMDMSGGAAVIAAVACAAKMGLKKNIVGLIPAAENAVSGEAMRPGDVYTSMSGKTVEVLHTDAEGRLVLADALTYAKKYTPRLIVDVATLTGAALVALGQHASAIMTKDRDLEDKVRDLGEESGDYVWPLPLWDEYKQYTKGMHGDISNIPQGDTRYGGTITAGAFLSHFAEGEKWLHIDMAPRMTAVQSDKLAKGATGEPTRLLVHIAETL